MSRGGSPGTGYGSLAAIYAVAPDWTVQRDIAQAERICQPPSAYAPVVQLRGSASPPGVRYCHEDSPRQES